MNVTILQKKLNDESLPLLGNDGVMWIDGRLSTDNAKTVILTRLSNFPYNRVKRNGLCFTRYYLQNRSIK